MRPELLTIVIAFVAVVVTAIGALYWWMNRTPSVRREPDGVLPLFGGDVEVNGQQWVPVVAGVRGPPPVERPRTPPGSMTVVAEPPGGAGSAAIMARQAAARPATPTGVPTVRPTAAGTVAPPGAATRDAGRTTAPSAPRVPASADDGRSDGPTIRTFTTSAAPLSAPPSAPAAPTPRAPAAGTPPSSRAAAPTVSTPSPSQPHQALPGNSPVLGYGVPGTMVEGHLIRYSVPAEGTLQFLPGRLEIAAGLDAGRDLRFVHVPGPNGMEVTFGRSEGELYRHIQLRDQTVSRTHARLRLHDNHWFLLNLSQTNPVVRNGVLLTDSQEHQLDDGDRIEMGEVLFIFRNR